MKKLLLGALATLFYLSTSFAQVVNVSGNITSNTTWTNNNIYLLDGYVYVVGATLTIEPGTLIKGVFGSSATIVITRTGKIEAAGTACQPIVFTSDQPAGSRAANDIGGVVILGNATINAPDVNAGSPGNQAVIEGGLDTPEGYGQYGGTDDNDNSGTLRYWRIEFAGKTFVPGSEINSLTMGGVGRGTTIDHIQTSYGGDDAYEWFGGTVNCKYLIAYKPVDDNFDTDFGYRGKVQYGIAFEDPNIADVSGSNGFESDNDGTGSENTPLTNALFSNITYVGPRATAATIINSNFKRGAHLRRNTTCSIVNSIIMGSGEVGLRIEGANTSINASDGDLIFRNNILAGNGSTGSDHYNCTSCDPSFNILTWEAGNSTTELSTTSGVSLQDPFNFSNPDFRPTALSIANFAGTNYSGPFSDPFFTNESFIGAMGSLNDWTKGWANWDPQFANYESPNINYNPVISASSVANSSCPSTGAIDITVTGGTGINTYSWSNGATSQDVAGLAPGSYSVTVTNNGCTAAASYSVIDVPVAKPTAVSLINQTQCSYTLKWTNAPGATNNQVRFRVSGGVYGAFISVGSANSYTFTGLTSGTAYDFQVRSACTGTSEKSGLITKSGTTSTTCGAPFDLTASAIGITTATLTWTDPCGPNTYKFRYRKVGTATWIQSNATTNTKSLSGLLANTTYECQVRTSCTGGSLSAWTASTNFTTLPLRIANEVIVDESLVELFPNPATDKVNLQIIANQEVNVHIADMTGRIVYTLNSIMVEDVYNTEIDTRNFAAGMYIVTIEGNNMLISKQLVVNK